MTGHLYPPHIYEPDICRVIDKFVQPGDLVIDAGACLGFFTIYMSKIVGDDGVVLAYEPFSETFRHLLYNVHVINKLNNVACFKEALWSWDRSELLLCGVVGEPGFTSSKSRYFKDVIEETVKCRCLDTVLGDRNHPRFIKADVEGAEFEVLQGAHKILERGVDCVVLEFNYDIMDMMKQSDGEIRGFMKDIGYDMFLINIPNESRRDYFDPIYVEPWRWIEVRRGGYNQRHINVMFSTRDKVGALWKTNNTLACSQTWIASCKSTSLTTTAEPMG